MKNSSQIRCKSTTSTVLTYFCNLTRASTVSSSTSSHTRLPSRRMHRDMVTKSMLVCCLMISVWRAVGLRATLGWLRRCLRKPQARGFP